jgi:hypothetical protein
MSGFSSLPRCGGSTPSSGGNATIARVPFTAKDWSAGIVNQIVVIPSGIPSNGQVGPHGLVVASNYGITVVNIDVTPDEVIDCETHFTSTGFITLVKSQKARPFNGVIIIVGSTT